MELLEAVNSNDIVRVKQLIDQGVDVDYKSQD